MDYSVDTDCTHPIDYSSLTRTQSTTEMIPGIYSAATAMERAAQRHELIAQNLAQINMPGYRRVTLSQQTFESTLDEARQGEFAFDSLGTSTPGPTNDFTPGAMERTNHPVDFAIQGDGFFAIETPGEVMYTRNGAFHVNGKGRIVTADGHPVQSDGGKLTLPPDSSPSQLTVNADGSATVNGVQIGKMKIVRFNDPHQLQSSGVTLFRAPNGISAEDSDAAIIQGTREHSNVQPVHELVDMIAASRAYEAAQKAMKTISSAIENHTNLRG